MLDIQGNICHGQVIHYLIKLGMGEQFDIVGISITVEHILGGMWFIFKEYSFGDTVLQLGFIFPGGRT